MKNLKRYRTLFVLAAVLLCICIPVVANAVSTYTVTYVDGLNGKSFATTSFTGLPENTLTPALGFQPSCSGYTFNGWNPSLDSTVTRDITYVAKWTVESSVNAYMVVYKDGFGNTLEEFPKCKDGDKTPAYSGGTPTHPGYIFTGWSPEIAEYVTGYAVYTAQWEVDPNYQPPQNYYPDYDEEPIPTPTPEPVADEENVSPKTGAAEVSLPALAIVALAAAALMVRMMRRRAE